MHRAAASRILFLAFAGLAQLVARHLAKVEVAGSIPVARSMHSSEPVHIGSFHMARWPSGKAEACKAFIPGSNPGLASNGRKGHPTGCPFAMRRCDKRGEPVCTGAGKNSPLRGVGESRILVPALAGLAQLVARHLAKVEVAGSIPVARSIGAYGRFRPAFFISQGEMAKW